MFYDAAFQNDLLYALGGTEIIDRAVQGRTAASAAEVRDAGSYICRIEKHTAVDQFKDVVFILLDLSFDTGVILCQFDQAQIIVFCSAFDVFRSVSVFFPCFSSTSNCVRIASRIEL